MSTETAQHEIARLCALDPLRYVVNLTEIARVIRESAPAHDPNGEPGDDLTHWARGCASACERVANACADSLDLRPSERAAFCAACGVANLSA